jgi:hypothetical protein
VIAIQGAADFTQSFTPQAFNIKGDVLGIERIWKDKVGILTSRFVTPTQSNHYIQGTNLRFVRGSSGTVKQNIVGTALKFDTPSDITGLFDFSWATYRSGFIRDTLIESGRAQIEFSIKSYQYDLNFTESSQSLFEGTIANYLCEFNLLIDPVYTTEVKQEMTRQLFPLLKGPLQRDLNLTFCSTVKVSLQSTVTSLLKSAQTSQKLSWTYGGYSMSKTLSLTPTNTEPFKENLFVITTNGTLKSNIYDLKKDKFRQENELQQISDSGLRAQTDDICFIFTDELIVKMINTNIDFYKQVDIVLNQDSTNQKYFPFNMWQFWEVTLYDLSLFNKIGNEEGQYRQTDPITMNCNFTNGNGSMINPDGSLTAKLSYRCLVKVKDTNRGGVVVILKDFTFDHNLSAKFKLTGEVLNAEVYKGEIDVSSPGNL